MDDHRTRTAARSTWRFHVGWIVAAILLAGCTGDGDTSGSTAEPTGATTGPPDSPTGSSAASSPVGAIEGLFDVGGHSLYLECRGTEPPTVLYIHGSITNPSTVPHANGEPYIRSLSDDHRVCVYDRRNVGDSDTVDAPQLPEDAIGDLHSLLAAAEVEPPYVLLGASFGGMLSYLYLNTYPDEVVGMVLLDAMFPDEMELEHLFPPEEQYEAFSEEDENESLERISHFKTIMAGQPFIGHEPSIPATYLASIPEGYEVNDYGIPEYDAQINHLQRQFIGRFAPGRYVRVDAPHFMEVVLANRITRELRRVIAAAGF